jgi:hypothetical protein
VKAGTDTQRGTSSKYSRKVPDGWANIKWTMEQWNLCNAERVFGDWGPRHEERRTEALDRYIRRGWYTSVRIYDRSFAFPTYLYNL